MQREVTLKDIFVAILRHFGQILAGALAFALVLGVLGGWRAYRAFQDPETQQKQEEAYLVKLGEYNDSVQQLELEVADAQRSRDALLEYSENSLYFQFDPSHVAQKQILFYVDTGYQIDVNRPYQEPDLTAQVVNAYADAYRSQDLYETMREVLGEEVDQRYLDELISVQRAGDVKVKDNLGNVTVKHSSENVRILDLRAVYSDQETADALADAVFALLQQQVQDAVLPHTVTVVSQSSGFQDDPELEKAQQETLTQLDQLSTTLQTKQAELAQKQATMPQPPEAGGLGSIVKKAVLYGVAGGIVGGMLGCLVVLCLFLADSRLGSLTAVERMCALPVLGALPAQKKGRRCLLEGLVRRLEDPSPMQPDAASAWKLFEANLAAAAAQSQVQQVLLCGETASLPQSEGTLGALRAGSVLTDPAAVQALENCQRTVLAVSSRQTAAQAQRELLRLKQLGKPALGLLWIEE